MAKSKNKKQVLFIVALLLTLSFVSFVMAESYCLKCLANNKYVLWGGNYNVKTEHLNCAYSTGKCTAYGYTDPAGCRQVCVDSLGYYAFNHCDGVVGIGSCESSGNNTEPALSLTANFPFADGGVFTKQTFFMDITTSKICSISLVDNLKGTERNLCPNCASYQKSMTFDQGANDITIRAVEGLEVKEKRIKFFIDNRAPMIISTLPVERSFASGIFNVSYSEANPKKITLFYGTGSYLNKTSTSCPAGDKQSCLFNIDLKSFDGKSINYWFEILDVAGNRITSKSTQVYVDTSSPLIENITYTIDRGNVNFKIKVKEAYLKSVGYSDSFDLKPTDKILCSQLVNNICDKKITLKDGEHNITIFVIDSAGHRTEKQVKLTTDSIAPKITLSTPTSGYANGIFNIQFIEANPKLLEMKYGNLVTGMRTKQVDLKTCYTDKGKTSCTVSVPIIDYNNQDISYYFSLTDIVNSKVETRPTKLKVDTTAPKITNFVYSGPDKYKAVTFNVTVDEKNFNKVVYYDNDLAAKTLCSSLKNNVCSQKVIFRAGTHQVKVEVSDRAGNVDSKTLTLNI
ncbi:Uncharacterised protein [uncultured archaeon]|nr:Uncharacterised protein [uncultured archaeon]